MLRSIDVLEVNLVIQFLTRLQSRHLCLNLLIVAAEEQHEQKHNGESQNGDPESGAKSDWVVGGLRCDENVGAHEISAVPNAQDDSSSNTLMCFTS